LLGLRSALRAKGWFEQQSIDEPNMAQFLDIVALGTVADVVPLDANNRRLVHHGLHRIRAGHARPGIAALLEIARRDYRRVKASDMGFFVGPRLNAAGRLDDMTLGEYVDLDTYLSKWDQIEKAMAVLYRPVVKTINDKYGIQEYKAEGQEIMKDMPMDVVLGSMLFFYRLGIDLSKVMTHYLESNSKDHSQLSHSLVQSGGGINQFMHSLRGILEDLKISLN